MELLEAYKIAATALAWAPFAIAGMAGGYVLSMTKGGGKCKLSAVWKEWKSSTATILVILVALLLASAAGQLNLTASLLIGLAGDQALNKWTVQQ